MRTRVSKYSIYFLLNACFLFFLVGSVLAQGTTIKVKLDQPGKSVSPLIYGQFIEFLGRCIDGGIYDEESALSDEAGFRKDVLERVRDLNVPIVRFPGGTVVKIYHWKDGIGKKEDRPKRSNLIWGGEMDNHFGTAEFVQYCRKIGAEPFLVVNMSSDSPGDASDWVEYCNGTGDTYWANLRRSHGYKEPFNVKYWGIGNEEYAEPDAGKHQDVKKYIDDSWLFVKLMKLQDPSIKITLVGNQENLAWSRQVLKEMHPVCDFLAVHFYSIPSDDSYETLLQSVDAFNANLDTMRNLLNEIPDKVTDFSSWYRFPPRANRVQLAIDEWGIWDIHSKKGKGDYQMEYPYNWGQALAVGKFLNMFQRNADIIGLATWAQMVNVLAPITTTADGAYCQTVYTPLHAYRKYSQRNNVSVEVQCAEGLATEKMLDVVASVSDNEDELVVSVINLSGEKTIKANLFPELLSSAQRMEILSQIIYRAASIDLENTPNKNVVEEEIISKFKKSGSGFEVIVKPASINFFVFRRLK